MPKNNRKNRKWKLTKKLPEKLIESTFRDEFLNVEYLFDSGGAHKCVRNQKKNHGKYKSCLPLTSARWIVPGRDEYLFSRLESSICRLFKMPVGSGDISSLLMYARVSWLLIASIVWERAGSSFCSAVSACFNFSVGASNPVICSGWIF